MMFDARRIVSAAGLDVVKVFDKSDGKHWDCGVGAVKEDARDVRGEVFEGKKGVVVERVRIKDGFLVEGRRDGGVGVWVT
jgi:division protein 1